MLRSMTAFARQEGQGEWGSLALELRSVNHRYLEIALRLPEELRSLEPQLRERIAARLGRGKVDVNLRLQGPTSGAAELVVDKDLAAKVAQASREIDALLYDPAPVNSMDVLRWPGILAARPLDAERLAAQALGLLESGLEELIDTRAREGGKLESFLLARCSEILEAVGRVRALMPEIQAQWGERLRARLQEVRAELDAGRLEQEMVMFAQKSDVSEELDRLEAHVEEVRRVLGQERPVGRRLDFLMQELNREANTLGSKSADARTTRISVDLKVLIEQMREQIQNIE